ncbi:MAG: hypothetical protein ACD_39C02092G0001 [uncultured bacterium]|nr:MAG: hypothetical protein ACD_39C02092G0001 [uncultured bacterium]
MLFFLLFNVFDDAGLTGNSLKTASVATITFWPINFDDHVSNFSGSKILAAVDTAIADMAATDTSSGKNAINIAKLTGLTKRILAKNAHVDVIIHENRLIQAIGKETSQRNIFPAKITGIQ